MQKLSAEQLTGMQELFFKTVFFLTLGHIAKIDGCISDVEVKLTETYKAATERSQKIQVAYSYIKKNRG